MRVLKLLLSAAIAAATLGIAVQTAAAGTLAVSEQRFKAMWPLLTAAGGGTSVSCPVTLEGSFHSRSMPTIARALVAVITSAVIAESRCTGGRFRALTETLPWHVQYDSFAGILPTITSVTMRVVGLSFSGEIFGISCLYRSTEAGPVKVIAELRESDTVVQDVRVDETARIPLSGNPFCPREETLSGEGGLTPASGEGEFIIWEPFPGDLRVEPGNNIEIPVGHQEWVIDLSNAAPMNSNRIFIEQFGVTWKSKRDGGGFPERFTKQPQEDCETRYLYPPALNKCTIEVRYWGARDDRPTNAILMVRWRTGAATLTREILVTAR